MKQFFGKRGVIEAKTPAELFTEVCGKILPDGKMDGIELLSKVRVNKICLESRGCDT